MLQGHDAPYVQNCVPEEQKKLFKVANRGGLCVPTEICFTVAAFIIQCYTVLRADKTIKARLIKTSNQRADFVHAVKQVVE